MFHQFKITSYAIIFFLMVGFSFAALQVATVEAQDNTGGCAPKERIKNMKDTARHSDYALWMQRCADGQTQDVCEHNKWTDWCEWSLADTGGFEGNSEAQAAAEAQDADATATLQPAQNDYARCHPNQRITDRNNTKKHSDYVLWADRCADKEAQDSCEGGQWKDYCVWGIPQVPRADNDPCCRSSTTDTCVSQMLPSIAFLCAMSSLTPQNKKNRYLELISQAPTAVSEATIPV